MGFSLVLVYYWALQFALASGDQVPRGSVLYLLMVGPIALYALLTVALEVRMLLTAVPRPAAWVLAHVLFVCAVALARLDVQTLASVGLFGLTVVAVLVKRPRVPSGLLTALMFAACLIQPFLYARGRSIYSLLPGMSLEYDLWWRVSLFPFVAPSAYFALLVFFVNWLDRDAPLRKTALLLSAYFVVFSGVRSALIAGLLAAFGLWRMRRGGLARPAHRTRYVVGALAALTLLLSISVLLAVFPLTSNATVNQYLYRSAEGLATSEETRRAVYRTYIWAEHFKVAGRNPLIGVGTFDFVELSTFDPLFNDSSTGSESFLTGLLARVGLPATLLLIVGFLSAAVRTGSRQAIRLVVGLVLFVAMLTYGSIVNAYDFVFLVMLSLLAAGPRIELPQRTPRSSQYLR